MQVIDSFLLSFFENKLKKKMAGMKARLHEQFKKSNKLQKQITQNMEEF